MPDAPEIPEATDPFEKRVAISIAVLAVFLSVIGNPGLALGLAGSIAGATAFFL